MKIGNNALNDEQDISELRKALEYDKSPELLALAIVVDLNHNNIEEAQSYFNTFKQVAKKSPLIGYIKQ